MSAAPKTSARAWQDLGALLYVSSIGISGLLAGTAFNDDLESSFGKSGKSNGNKGNATFPGIAFFRNSDDHEDLVLSVAARGAKASVTHVTKRDTGELKTVSDWEGRLEALRLSSALV